MLSPKFPRKKSFVSAKIQGRILGRFAAYWVLYHVVLWQGLFVYRYVQHRTAVAGGAPSLPFGKLYDQFLADYSPLLMCAALILPLLMIDFCRMTHRIAGPLVRFKTALHMLMAGERVDKVALRRGDLLTEFEEEFNQFLAFYNGQLRERARAAECLSVEQAQMVTALVESRSIVGDDAEECVAGASRQ